MRCAQRPILQRPPASESWGCPHGGRAPARARVPGPTLARAQATELARLQMCSGMLCVIVGQTPALMSEQETRNKNK